MLKTLLATVVCMLITAPLAAAQGPEFFIGYSNLQAEGLPERNDPSWVFNTDFFRARTTLHGVNAELSGYVKGVGFTGDFSFNRKGRTDAFTAARMRDTLDTYYFLAGPSFKFSQVQGAAVRSRMAGGAHTRFEASRSLMGHRERPPVRLMSAPPTSQRPPVAAWMCRLVSG